MTDQHETIPAPPPASDWPGLDEDTAVESPRALTPPQGTPGAKRKRSGDYAAPSPPLPGIPPKLDTSAGRYRSGAK